jgi:hypothetical protein
MCGLCELCVFIGVVGVLDKQKKNLCVLCGEKPGGGVLTTY